MLIPQVVMSEGPAYPPPASPATPASHGSACTPVAALERPSGIDQDTGPGVRYYARQIGEPPQHEGPASVAGARAQTTDDSGEAGVIARRRDHLLVGMAQQKLGDA